MATAATTLWALATVKTYLGITDTSKDTAITQIADSVTRRMEEYTNRVFVTREVTEIRNGTGTLRLPLWKFPISTSTGFTLTQKLTQDQATPDSYTYATDFDLDLTDAIIRMRSVAFARLFQNVTVTYKPGYGAQDAAALPPDVYEAGLALCKFVFDKLSAGVIAASSVNLGASGMLVIPGMPWEIRQVLEYWRAVRLEA